MAMLGPSLTSLSWPGARISMKVGVMPNRYSSCSSLSRDSLSFCIYSPVKLGGFLAFDFGRELLRTKLLSLLTFWSSSGLPRLEGETL